MMKKNSIHLLLTALLLLSGTLVGCNKFLDVQPKGTLPEDMQFSDEQGFKDALYGVYALMGDKALYGENLTYGFVDKLGQMFEYFNTSNPDNEITKYQYTHLNVRPRIDEIWASQYYTIAAVNLIIEHAEATDLTGETMDIIKGEAYALRAFLHFDLARLFCVRYADRSGKSGIPYAFVADQNNKELFDIKEVYKNILADLDKAEALLQNDNTLNAPLGLSKDPYYDERFSELNKYAVMALKARVYYTMGDMTRAAEYARKVIGADVVGNADTERVKPLALAKPSEFRSVKDFPGTGEIIFGIYADKQAQNIYDLFRSNPYSGNFTEARKDLKALYETDRFTATNTDLRYAAYYKEESKGTFGFIRFIEDESALKLKAFRGIPLIRLPEMYYILSESLYDTNKEESIKLLNEVRASRGLEPIAEATVETKDKYIQEMIRERMREMPGEGQVFFASKLYNLPILARNGKDNIQPSEEVYVLPWPEAEKEFGNIKK